MNKDGSEREGKGRIVGSCSNLKGGAEVDVLIDYVLMCKCSWGEGKYEMGRKYMSS